MDLAAESTLSKIFLFGAYSKQSCGFLVCKYFGWYRFKRIEMERNYRKNMFKEFSGKC